MPLSRATSAASAPAPDLPDELLRLVRPRLANLRPLRYGGDGVSVSLGNLAETDQASCRRLYDSLQQLLPLTAKQPCDWASVMSWRTEHSLDDLTDAARELGHDSDERGLLEHLAEALHDVRGGALSALLGRLYYLERLPRNEESMATLFVLTRDHLKIMRNAIVGLDDARRAQDQQSKAHDVALIVAKWRDSLVGPEVFQRPVRMTVRCDYEGTLAECCLESAAVDRVFYNLANNAARHAASDLVEVAIFRPEPTDLNLRIVISNGVSEADAAELRVAWASDESSRSDLDLRGLFEPGVSTTGSGLGLAIVSEVVANAFGLENRQSAVRDGYVGAKLQGSRFRAWFHWPTSSM